MTQLQKADRRMRLWSDRGTHMLMVSIPVLYSIAFMTPFVGMMLVVDPLF